MKRKTVALMACEEGYFGVSRKAAKYAKGASGSSGLAEPPSASQGLARVGEHTTDLDAGSAALAGHPNIQKRMVEEKNIVADRV